jgi:polyribonucleotide 5'-hydroxyl-kinase
MLSSLLPGGETEDPLSNNIFDQIEPSSNMQNAILAVVQANPNDSHDSVRDASVIGFVYVAEVDDKKRRLRVLAPLSGRVPRRVLVWGHWPETAGELVG